VLAFWLDATAEPSTTDDAAGLEGLLERSPGALIVALDADAIVGTIVAGWDGWRGALYRLAVQPSYRRRGIATRLVAEAEQLLRDQGVRRMHLIASRAGGETAESFWISTRYEPTDQVRFVKSFD
jgi:ribosomal protein S18 acetylase RimI-like enzyme